MRSPATLLPVMATTLSVLIGGTAVAQKAPAFAGIAKPAARGALATGRAGDAPGSVDSAGNARGCLDTGSLLQHAAYVRTTDSAEMRCGHLLSTDTLMTVHHWDRT